MGRFLSRSGRIAAAKAQPFVVGAMGESGARQAEPCADIHWRRAFVGTVDAQITDQLADESVERQFELA